jgi:hypothetical protein
MVFPVFTMRPIASQSHNVAPSRMTTRCPVVTLWHSTFVGLTPVTEPLNCQALLLLAMFLYILGLLVSHLILRQVRKTSCAFQRQQR